jgi:hypothetical protein
MERGIERGVVRAQPVKNLALSYYYLMIGLSMSVRMYDRETMMQEARSAWEGLRSGLNPNP